MEKAVSNGNGAALPMARGGRMFHYSDYILGGGQKACCNGQLGLRICPAYTGKPRPVLSTGRGFAVQRHGPG